MTDIQHKMIDAEELLLARFPKPRNDYQRGWNDALETAYDVETEAETRDEVG